MMPPRRPLLLHTAAAAAAVAVQMQALQFLDIALLLRLPIVMAGQQGAFFTAFDR